MTTQSQMTPGAARVIDPILTSVARGYTNMGFVFPSIFPIVPVAQRGGKLIEFNAEHFAEMDIERAVGANIPEINIGYAGKPYALTQRSLAGKVPIELMEEASAVPGIALASVAIDRVMQIVGLQIEIQAGKLIAPSNFTGRTKALAGNNKWDNDGANPAKEVRSAYSGIRSAIGRDPNTLLIGKEVYDALINSKPLIDRIKDTMPAVGDTLDEDILRRYFKVERLVVGGAMTGKKGAFKHIWGKIALLCYTNVTPLAAQGSPSFGYTYRLNGYPIAEAAYYKRENRSWMYPVTTEDTPAIVGVEGAYLWTAVIT